MHQTRLCTTRIIGWIGLFSILFLSTPLFAATLYVSPTGTKTSGASTADDWSSGNCYGTISAAIQRMSGGDEVVVNDGVYSGIGNAIGRYSSFTVPSGTASRYTVVRARNPFKATIDSGVSSAWDYNGRMIYLPSTSSYVQVDGFRGINRDGSNNAFVSVSGNHIKITRCQFRTEGVDHNENCVVEVGGSASYVLFEDCAITGGYRYGFIIRGVGSNPNHVIFRRCVARGDWVRSNEPNSIFAVYGHNSSAASGPHDIMYQNCIAINQNASKPDADWKPYGPWYIFKGNNNITLNGCITLNNNQTGSTSGAWIRNDYGGKNIDVINSIFWGFTGGIGITFGGSTVNVKGCTFGGNDGYSLINHASTTTFKNNLVIKSPKGTLYGTAFNSTGYNSFDAGSFGSNLVTYKNDLLYLTRVESTSNRFNGGEGGGRVGAHIVKKMGNSGSLWGDTGWNTETGDALWPWPYESQIKEWFSTPNTPPAGASPATNNTKRGFCADGQSLTRYIWEYLGKPLPSDIGSGGGDTGGGQADTTPPLAPKGLAAKTST